MTALRKMRTKIGIVLYANKNDVVIKFTFPTSTKSIIASQYHLYLLTEQQLLEEDKKTAKIKAKTQLNYRLKFLFYQQHFILRYIF